MQRCAVFSCLGMGDGLIALVLSNNLHLNGGIVTTFHPFLDSLQGWFVHLPIRRFPSTGDLEEVLQRYDRYFIFFEKSPWMQAIIQHCQRHYQDRTTILNPIATPRSNYPYWENGRFNGNRSFVENLYTYCEDILRFTVVTRSNGISFPEGVQPRRFGRRVVIHPSSSREGKNWPREKYLQLIGRLKGNGYAPSLILTQEERQGWDLDGLEAPLFANLFKMTSHIAESGYMIGNDSGIGHLASCIGLPTLTICRSAQVSRFWRPAWTPGEVITPSTWIPNIKGFRLRDQHWKKWITVRKVLDKFSRLT
jgi:heptosyltransferase-3